MLKEADLSCYCACFIPTSKTGFIAQGFISCPLNCTVFFVSRNAFTLFLCHSVFHQLFHWIKM